MPIGEETYIRVALEESDETWELLDGWLRAKPGGSVSHNHFTAYLGFGLIDRIDREGFEGRIDSGRLRCSSRNYYVPDTFVIPPEYLARWDGREESFEVYDDPMPLVAED